MKSIQFAKLGVLLVTFTCIHAAPSPSQVQVQVHHHATKRSPDEKASISLSITGDSHKYKLNLKNPETSVFSKNFKYTVVKENSQGNIVFEDETPSKVSLDQVETQIYTDAESNSAVIVKTLGNGHQVHGIVDNLSVIPGGESNNDHLVLVKSNPQEPSNKNDYIDMHRNITHSNLSTRTATNYQPEVWVIFDYDNSQNFGNDRDKILDYLGVFFHAVNNRYATITDPLISFRISGVTVMSSRSSQPFMENNKVPASTGYDVNKVLDDFSKWSFANQATGPKFDMAAVISGVDFQSKDSNGVYSSGVSGLAYLSAACWKGSDRWYAASVSEDIGANFDGVYTVAHEFAHNLGSPHDGQGNSTSCSWDAGYIMSYVGWGTTNKFYFSPCSITRMKNFVTSTQGECLNSLQSSTNIPISASNVGDRYTMTEQCIKYTKQPKAVTEPTKTADELCKNLACRYPTPGKPVGSYSITTLNHPPGDNTPCGTAGGKCVNGNCVTTAG